MAYTSRVAWETLRSVDSAAFAGAYVALGAPLAHASMILKLVNNSTSLVTISIDGVNDVDVAPSKSFWLYDEMKTQNYEMMQKGTQIYVKGAAGVGLVYLATQYLIEG